MSEPSKVDVIGGFQAASSECAGCGKPLLMENAWMTDGCPCNSPLGVNSMNETRWRLLMQLQQEQSRRLEVSEKVWRRCKVIYYPLNGVYPIEHVPKIKESREMIEAALKEPTP